MSKQMKYCPPHIIAQAFAPTLEQMKAVLASGGHKDSHMLTDYTCVGMDGKAHVHFILHGVAAHLTQFKVGIRKQYKQFSPDWPARNLDDTWELFWP